MSSGRPLRCGVGSTYSDVVAGAGAEPVRPVVDQADRPGEPAVAQLEIVVADDGMAGLGIVVGLELLVLVVAEQAAEDDRLVGEAQLVVVEPGGVPDQVGRPPVLLDAFLDELDPLLDPVVLIFRGVPLDRDVVGQVPALEGPDREEVGLELGDQLDGGLRAGPSRGRACVPRRGARAGRRRCRGSRPAGTASS